MQAAKAAAPTRSSLPRSSKTGDETHTMAVMLTLFVGPWLGFLYLGRRGFACAYVAYSAAIIVLFTQFYFEDWVFHATAPYSFLYFLLVHVAGALHCANRGYGTAPGPSEFTDRQIARVLVLPAFLLIMLALLLSIFATQRQPGPSMAPSYSINAPYIFNRLAFRFREPQRGDVILYRTKVRGSTLQRMARIIGLPGDRIAMKLGIPVLNDVPLSRRPMDVYRLVNGSARIEAPCFLETLPEGASYPVLASEAPGTGAYDNRPERVVPEGHFFVLGDNRTVSRDSRDFDGVGFVAAEDVIGKAMTFRLSDPVTTCKGYGNRGDAGTETSSQ